MHLVWGSDMTAKAPLRQNSHLLARLGLAETRWWATHPSISIGFEELAREFIKAHPGEYFDDDLDGWEFAWGINHFSMLGYRFEEGAYRCWFADDDAAVLAKIILSK
jgi:hypothetical protein